MVDSLRVEFAVSIPGPGENPLRAVRRLHPAAILLAVPRGRSNEAVRTCRLIKTDSGTPPLVGLLDQWSRIRRPERTLSHSLADGYIGGKIDSDDLLGFTISLLRSERRVLINDPPPGLFKRLLR